MSSDKLEEFLIQFLSDYASKLYADYKFAERIFDLRWKPELKIHLRAYRHADRDHRQAQQRDRRRRC